MNLVQTIIKQNQLNKPLKLADYVNKTLPSSIINQITKAFVSEVSSYFNVASPNISHPNMPQIQYVLV